MALTKRLDFIQVCTKAFVKPSLAMLPLSCIPGTIDEEARKQRMLAELKIGTEISTLVGPQEIRTFLEHENSEVTAFRRAAGRQRDEAMRAIEIHTNRDEEDRIHGLPMFLLNEPLPLDIPEALNIVCHFPTANNANSKINCDVRATATTVRAMAITKFKRVLGQDQSATIRPEDYLLKFTGYQDYLHGPYKLIEFDHVRRRISSKGVLELSLVLRAPLQQYLEELHQPYRSMVDEVRSRSLRVAVMLLSSNRLRAL